MKYLPILIDNYQKFYLKTFLHKVMKYIRANISKKLMTEAFQSFVCDYLERVQPDPVMADNLAQVKFMLYYCLYSTEQCTCFTSFIDCEKKTVQNSFYKHFLLDKG